MSEIADRYRRVSATFTEKVDQVPAGAWDNPAPPEGWATRDVVGHLVEWLPAFFCANWNIAQPNGPSVDDDPAGAWKVVQQTFQDALDDPAIAEQVQDDLPMGPLSFERCFDMIGTNDVFMHTWDLARAAGLDETLDPAEVHSMFVGMEPMDEMMRASGQFGPRIPVPDDADEQTKLIAFIGRQP